MPRWESQNGRASLSVDAEDMSARFAKETGEVGYQGTNGLVVHEDRSAGSRQVIIAEGISVSEDASHVYLQTRGRVVQETERISGGDRGSARRVDRGEQRHA